MVSPHAHDAHVRLLISEFHQLLELIRHKGRIQTCIRHVGIDHSGELRRDRGLRLRRYQIKKKKNRRGLGHGATPDRPVWGWPNHPHGPRGGQPTPMGWFGHPCYLLLPSLLLLLLLLLLFFKIIDLIFKIKLKKLIF
jgi:hypothetical protein